MKGTSRSFEASALYIEIIALTHSPTAVFQHEVLQPLWQGLAHAALGYRLLLLDGDLKRRSFLSVPAVTTPGQ
jgi:hypothetical protein